MDGPPYNVARLPIYYKNFKNFFQKFHLKFFFYKIGENFPRTSKIFRESYSRPGKPLNTAANALLTKLVNIRRVQ